MSNTFKDLFIFAIGAAIGSVVTWKFVKDKYERIAQEEIESVKEVFSSREEALKKTEEVKKEEELKEASDKLNNLGYKTSYSEFSESKRKEDAQVDKPYVISPDEFGELYDYDQISLRYYSDGVLVDDADDEIVDNIEEIVGFDSLNHFGEYEDDSVFVRNDRLKVDYEILLDLGTYEEARKKRPHPKED